MSITNKFLDLKVKQSVLNWQGLNPTQVRSLVLPIAVGQQVVLSDGHPGWITHLLPDRDGWIETFVIQTRGWWRRRVVIPMEYIDHIDGETVYLALAKIELKNLPT